MTKLQKPSKEEILQYFHCKECALEWKNDKSISSKMSPREYAKISVGWTKKGLQIYCFRHDLTILNLDFKGQKVSQIP